MIYNVKLPEKSELEDLKKVELKKEDFYDLRLSEAESIELNGKLNDEKLRKESIDYKYPKLTADVGYSLKNHSVVFGLGVTKTFKRYNDTIEDLKNEMLSAADSLDFERAASIRDEIKRLKEMWGLDV